MLQKIFGFCQTNHQIRNNNNKKNNNNITLNHTFNWVTRVSHLSKSKVK
jgi:hypothetical protein